MHGSLSIFFRKRKMSDLKFFKWRLQKMTCNSFFPLYFHRWKQICFQNWKILAPPKFWKCLLFSKCNTKVNFWIPCLIMIFNVDCKIVFSDENWGEKCPMCQYLESAFKIFQIRWVCTKKNSIIIRALIWS